MFTPDDRRALREALIARAGGDDRVVAAALVGSSATGAEDEWSDIDLALAVEADRLDATIEDWTTSMYEAHGAVHHLDVRWEATVYRVFLLGSTLQVDISFWPSAAFIATGPRFRLLFGDPPVEHPSPEQPSEAIIVEAWLYLIHVRSSIARGHPWQADHMLATARDHVLELACRRHDLDPDHARGVDELPGKLLAEYAAMRPSSLAEPELRAALRATVTSLDAETRHAAPALAGQIRAALEEVGS